MSVENVERARRTLTKSRNNEYHGRRLEEMRLATGCDEVRGELETLLKRLDFFLDNPLVVAKTSNGVHARTAACSNTGDWQETIPSARCKR